MRILVLLLSFALGAAPLAAQQSDDARIDKRIGKLESEMRAVQRKVFPGADARYFEPEITAPEVATPAIGNPATAPLTDLADRVGELERQLRTLTGQVEAAQFKLRALEEAQMKQRADVEFRLNAIESRFGPAPAAATAAPDAAGTGPAMPQATPDARPETRLETRTDTGAIAEPAPAKPAKPAVKPPAKAATADAAWKLAYANVLAKDWPATEAAMTAYLADWPKSTRLPQAQFWLGRSHAERDEPAEAARAFLKVYETAPRSAQAPDSLIGLAAAMIGLKKPKDACRVLGELDSVYGEKLSPEQKTDAAAQRKRAKCAA